MSGQRHLAQLSRLLRYDELALLFTVHSSGGLRFLLLVLTPDRHKLRATIVYRAQTTDSGTRCRSEASAAIGTPWPSESPAN